MWDLSFVVPSMLVLFVFTMYYFTLPTVPIRTNRIYIRLIVVEVVTLLFDVTSSWADMNFELFPQWTLYVLNCGYFVMFIIRICYFFAFSLYIVKMNSLLVISNAIVVYLPACIGVFIALVSPYTGWLYYIDETGYHSGSIYYALYMICWIYIFLSYVSYARKQSMFLKRERSSFFWYNMILFVGTIMRLVFPQYLMMDTFCVIALVVIYVSFVNPDFYLEGRTNVFNSKALRAYLEEQSGRKKFRILAVSIKNYRYLREIYGIRQMAYGISLICIYLHESFKGNKVFYYRSGRFAILGNESMDYEKILGTIKERFISPWVANNTEIYLEVGAAVMNFGGSNIPFEVEMSSLMEAFSRAADSDGREIIQIDESVTSQMLRENEIKRALEYAIDNDEVEVFLQPIINSKTGKIEGAEALSRIRDFGGNIISPTLFVPIAEKNGRINQLGEQAFEKTCKFVYGNDMESLGLSWINVNLSPLQFVRTDLAGYLSECIQKYDIKPEMIHLEITEEAMVDENLLKKQMNAIVGKGFKFALDDYGKGYSNMARLKQCPFVNIKLDMSIVWNYCSNEDEMIPNLVKAFSNMGFFITAEGIENEDIARKMTDIGCNYLQGYYYSEPVPVSEFVKKYSK